MTDASSQGCFILVNVTGSQCPDYEGLYANRRLLVLLFSATALETRTHPEELARF